MCIAESSNSFSLTDAADIAQVIIAIFNVGFAFYLFGYEKRKDIASFHQQEHINRLQGFKELVLQPNISLINNFYTSLTKNCMMLCNDGITDELKHTLNENNKKELSNLRVSFTTQLLKISKPFHAKISDNLDHLIDQITVIIFNGTIDCSLNQDGLNIFEVLLHDSRNQLMSDILDYDGSNGT